MTALTIPPELLARCNGHRTLVEVAPPRLAEVVLAMSVLACRALDNRERPFCTRAPSGAVRWPPSHTADPGPHVLAHPPQTLAVKELAAYPGNDGKRRPEILYPIKNLLAAGTVLPGA
jgi:hypothetical protein